MLYEVIDLCSINTDIEEGAKLIVILETPNLWISSYPHLVQWLS